MKSYAVINAGLEKTAVQEFSEKYSITATSFVNLITFDATEQQLVTIANTSQSIRKLCLFIGNSLEEFPNFDLANYWEGNTFKVEVEYVKGQDNRLALSRKLLEHLNPLLPNPTIDLKKPDFYINITKSEDKHYVGIDLCGVDLNSRHYRVFPHSASFKGDAAYHIVRSSKFTKGNKLLIGFAKDGALPIEAAIYATNSATNLRTVFSYEKFKSLKDLKPLLEPKFESNIFAFDEGSQNFQAARKNSKLAQVPVTIHKMALDDLDVKFEKEQFDNIIFQLTTKDEDRLNEIYYQSKYLLKKGGTLLFSSRESWDPSFPDYLTIEETSYLERGDSKQKLILLRRNS